MQDDEGTAPSKSAGAAIPERDARAELDRLEADTGFHCSDRNKKFLRFVAEEAFAGRSDHIKAYTIAVDVFGRPSSFDAATDPIVRIEATRLRAALARYYDHRPVGSIGIELPKGRYVPNFYRESRTHGRTASEAEANAADVPDVRSSGKPMPGNPSRRTGWLAAAVGIAAIALLTTALGSRFFRQAPHLSEKPVVSVEFLNDQSNFAESEKVHDGVLVAFSRFQALRVRSYAYTGTTAANTPHPDYRIVLKYGAARGARTFWWQVIDVAEAEAVESGESSQQVSDPPRDAELENLLRKLSLRLAGLSGVINNRILLREMEHPTLGNGCILRAFRALQLSGETAASDAKACLVETIAVQPSNSDAKGLLALFVVRDNDYDEPNAALDTALHMVRDASVVAPDSTTVAYARMTLEFLNGRADLAVATGRGALEINPFHGAITARLAEILFFTGHRAMAIFLARRASEVDGIVYRDAELTFAMDAYVNKQYDEALGHLERAGSESSYGPAMIKVAVLGQLGLHEETASAKRALLARWPRFEATFQSMMQRLGTDRGLLRDLTEGLGKAGLAVSS